MLAFRLLIRPRTTSLVLRKTPFARLASGASSDSLHVGKSASIKEVYEISKDIRDDNVHINAKVPDIQFEIEKIEQNIRNLATPRQMKTFLDNYVIGQDNCKKIMAVAIYNHYLRMNDKMIRRLKLLKMHGGRSIKYDAGSTSNAMPGASEKSQLALEFSKGNSDKEPPELQKSNLMMIGPSGSGKTLLAKTMARVLDVPIVIQDCTSLTQAGYIGEDITDCIQKLFARANYDVDQCERGIVVLDEVDKLARKNVMAGSKDISGEGVQQSLLKLIEGSQVPVVVKGKDSSRIPSGSKASAPDIAVDTSNILFIAMGAFVGLDEIVTKRLVDAEVKEMNEDDTTPSLSGLERVTPEDLVKYGMIPEFIGRLPIIAPLKGLTAEDLERVLVRPKNSIIRQYQYTFSRLGIQLAVTGPSLQTVAQLSLKNGTGARGLQSILSKLLLSANYDCPGSDISYVLIDREVIQEFVAFLNGGKSLDNFKPKYYRDHEHSEFLDTIKSEDPELESKLRDDLV